jgi:hypothetical protein
MGIGKLNRALLTTTMADELAKALGSVQEECTHLDNTWGKYEACSCEVTDEGCVDHALHEERNEELEDGRNVDRFHPISDPDERRAWEIATRGIMPLHQED